MTNVPVLYEGRMAEIHAMANAVVKSRLFPQAATVEAAMTLMLLCDCEGIHPMMALRRWDIINGRPALKTDAMLADFQKRGGKVKWIQLTEDCVEAEFMAQGLSDPVRIKFDTSDAKRAGLLAKDNWVKYPRAMRRARVVSEGIRTADPGVNAGVYTPEEVQDFDSDAQPQDNEIHRAVRAKVGRSIARMIEGDLAAGNFKPAKEPPAEPVEPISEEPVDEEPPAILESLPRSPLFDGAEVHDEDETFSAPEDCKECGGKVTLHFSESKRFPNRPYYQCEKAYQEKLSMLNEGISNKLANGAVGGHYRAWSGPWHSTSQP